jgi:hypothetical protein
MNEPGKISQQRKGCDKRKDVPRFLQEVQVNAGLLTGLSVPGSGLGSSVLVVYG